MKRHPKSGDSSPNEQIHSHQKRVAIRAFFMQRYARLTNPRWVKVQTMGRPFSNFDFIDSEFGGESTLPRLMSQVRCHGAQTMVIEKLGPSTELAEENRDLRILTGHKFQSRAYRLSFFKRKIHRNVEIRTLTNRDFIGYAVVKRDVLFGKAQSHVYESVIKKSRHPNNCIRGEQTWKCRVEDHYFSVKGYLYAQQNKLTNVCAHAALRTVAARFHRGDELSYRKMNETVGIDHIKRKAEKGLGSDEITQILESIGVRCSVLDFTGTGTEKPPASFQKYIYGSIESGFPAIIFFGTAGSADEYHVVPVFGHTFNEDTWVPSAERYYFRVGADVTYIPSDSWLSMFVGHDDNYGSNVCIPKHYLQTKRHPTSSNHTHQNKKRRSQADVDSVAFIIATLPTEIELSPIRAEVIGADYLLRMLPKLPNRRKNKWTKRLLKYAKENQLVLRPILISPQRYIKHLERISDWSGLRTNPKLLPVLRKWARNNVEYLWMIELSVPELFSANKRKLGEILLRADSKVGSERDMESFVFARLPGHFSFYQEGGASNPNYLFIASGLDTHVELYGCEDGRNAG